jgi:hypothetical protein
MRIVMRFNFPNLDRPKKAAKRIARLLGGGIALSKAQNGLAVALGYRDWHELEFAHASHPPTPLDQHLAPEDFHLRSADLTMRLAKSLDVSLSEAQYALLASRLTGDRTTRTPGVWEGWRRETSPHPDQCSLRELGRENPPIGGFSGFETGGTYLVPISEAICRDAVDENANHPAV